MRANRATGSRPEEQLRRALWKAGLRGYRKNKRDLPGRPDIVFSARRLVIDVRGCFWHLCPTCRVGKEIKTNATYWVAKISMNVDRDLANELAWRDLGFEVVVVWEHEIRRDVAAVINRIKEQLDKEAK
jgi:DNA mismatch endonuclease (patch repair protein)